MIVGAEEIQSGIEQSGFLESQVNRIGALRATKAARA